MGGDIPGGNFLGEKFPGGNFPGGSFPDTLWQIIISSEYFTFLKFNFCFELA